MNTTSLSYREQLFKLYWMLDDLVTNLHYMAFDVGMEEEWPNLKMNPNGGDEMPVTLKYLRKVNRRSADGILVMIKVANMAIKDFKSMNQFTQEELNFSLFENKRRKKEDRKCQCKTTGKQWACKLTDDIGLLFHGSLKLCEVGKFKTENSATDFESLTGAFNIDNCMRNVLFIAATHNKLSEAFIRYGFLAWKERD